MSQAPRGEVRENVLARLIAPHGEIARKRVTLLYRVIDPGEAARIVERDLHNAEFRVNSATQPTARAVVEQHVRARHRPGGGPRRGAGELRDARHCHGARRRAAARRAVGDRQSRPTARVACGPSGASQDSAFAAALPVGLFLPAHLKVPESIRAGAMRAPSRPPPQRPVLGRTGAARAARLDRAGAVAASMCSRRRSGARPASRRAGCGRSRSARARR